MAGRFEKYMRESFLNVEDQTKRAIQSALLRGLSALIGATKQDSSRAAFHWSIIGSRGEGSAPGNRKYMTYHPGVRGKAPVGERGDAGANSSKVLAYREKSETRYLKGRLNRRKPDTVFSYYNPILEDETYAKNAHLIKARDEAIGVANEHFERLMRRRAAYKRKH